VSFEDVEYCVFIPGIRRSVLLVSHRAIGCVQNQHPITVMNPNIKFVLNQIRTK